MSFKWIKNTASNAIFTGDEVAGKGKIFKCRFLESGLVKYSFGVCLLTKENLEKFVYNFVGIPVIIGHQDLTNNNVKEERVGAITDVWYDSNDGWYWAKGIIFDEKAISLINDGYNVSCQYEITEYAENRAKDLHNGNSFDKTILNGRPEHLAIVKNPRYESAMIAVNAIEKEEIYKAENGFITLDEIDPLTGKRRVIWIPGNAISKGIRDRILRDTSDFKEGAETKFVFSHTKVKPTEEQVKYLKDTLNGIQEQYKFKGVAQIEISSELNKGSLGVCFSPDNTSLISLSPQLYNGKYTQEKYDNGVKKGWNPKGTGEMVKSVLVHELGHAITVNSQDNKFWDKVETIRKDYMKNIKKTDIENPDFISNYARTNKYEFVAEAFCQGCLAKKYGRYTKQIMDIMNEHFSKTSQLKLSGVNKEDDDNSDDMWIEGFGYGYPMDEETYEEWKKEQRQEQKQENKKSVAKNDIIQAINEIKETKMFKGLFKKEQKMDREELKEIFLECLTGLTASNEVKEEEKEETENKCKNEATDKRKLIDEVAGIMKSAGADDELIRTAIAKMEKLAYDKSEEETADNKCKNEDEEKDKEMKKLEKEVDKESEKAKEVEKAKNSIEEQKQDLFKFEEVKSTSRYMTKEQGLKLGEELF